MLAIMGAGSLLLRQAHASHRDARQKTGFVSNVSHELKTPLTTIRMYAELLGENRVRDPEKRMNYLDVIVHESQRLTRLVNNVLDFGRLEGASRRFDIGSVDLVDFIRGIIETQQVCRDRTDFPITLKTTCESCLVAAEADALEQIILNILDNAVKYAGAGDGVVLRIYTEDDSARLEILDRGPGIPHNHRRKIFDKFHRVDDSLTSGKAGSGLGLSIAKGLAEGMNAQLGYRDREGGGSAFQIILPLAKPAACRENSETLAAL